MAKSEDTNSTHKILQDGTFFTYAFLLDAAFHALHASKETEGPAQNAHRLSVVLYCAFAIEAHLNHVGEQHIRCWDEIERKLNPEGKQALIAERFGATVDRSQRPFQTFRDIIRLRNFFAHGRTEYHNRTIQSRKPTGLDGPDTPFIDPKFLESLTEEFVDRVYNDTNDMIQVAHDAAGFDYPTNLIHECMSFPLDGHPREE